MKPRRTVRTTGLPLVALLACLGAAPAAAQDSPHHELGNVDFPVSCAPGVQPEFERAAALLHHMMYQESLAAFERIAEEHPGCAMAHWGIAMTLFQPLWPGRPGPDALARGREAARTARSIGAATDRERDFVAAAHAFFRDPDADWWTRIRRWAEAMEAAYRARPDDVETAAFYALSQLAVGQVAEDQVAYHDRAAEVLLEIHEREPTHPGALHYTIHANDVDARAGKALEVVRSYDRVAPSVPHALHMPTHVFVRLGKWSEVIEWNARSAEAALDLPAEKGVSLHHIHALDYLVYAHLQRGEDRKAAAALADARGRRYQAGFQAFAAAYHFAAMPARIAVERRAWGEAARLEPRSPDYLPWENFAWPEALTWFARGLGAAHAGDLDAARRSEARMRELRENAEAAGEKQFAGYIEVDRRVLAAYVAKAEGRAEEAVELARAAVELERTLQKHPVSPGAVLPASEALGDLLRELGRPAEAVAAYRASLETWPKRFNTLLGAARAARDAGDPGTARKYYAELLETAEGAETEREGVAEARAFVDREAPGP